MTKSPTRESPLQRTEQPRHRNVYDCDGEYEFAIARHWTTPEATPFSGKTFTPGFVLLVVALVLMLDASLALKLSSG